ARAREKYSCSPRPVHPSSTALKSRGGAQHTRNPRRGRPTAAVSSLARSTSECRRELLFGGAPKPTLSALVVGQGEKKFLAAKIRPQGVGHVDLSVGQLPEQEIAQAQLSTGADE